MDEASKIYDFILVSLLFILSLLLIFTNKILILHSVSSSVISTWQIYAIHKENVRI